MSYVCRKCGATYPFEHYKLSRFCDRCGTLLRKETYFETTMLRDKKMKVDFQDAVKKFFPYQNFRPYQLSAIKFSFDVIKNGKVGLLSSPCGTGKSISVLTAYFLARDLDNSTGKLLALTRTRNQLEIYCRELKSIKEHCNVSLIASVFKSKKELCPYAMEDPKLREVSYRDFIYYCKGLKEGLFRESCQYYERTYSASKPSWHAYNVINKIKSVGPLLPDEVYEICREREVCPYEVTKILARHADVIVGNYNYILVSSIRGSILGRAGIQAKHVNCVFDEAHSLPYYAAGIFSNELSITSVRRALKEVETFNVNDFGFLNTLKQTMVRLGKKVYKKYGLDVEHIIEKDVVIKALLKNPALIERKLTKIFSELLEMGEFIRQKRAEAGKSPISYLSRCASFLLDWVTLAGSSYVQYVKVDVDRDRRKTVRLGIKCLDPSLAANVINELRSAILMSGTLWHTDYYIDILGIDRKKCESMELPSPFLSENRLILVDEAVTTKYEERNETQWRNIAEHLTQIIRLINGRIAVYFPSYDIMRRITSSAKLELPFFVEERNTKIIDVLQFLKNNQNCLVFGVARGKISEGVDMTTEGKSMLSAVIIVGLPYPKKTEVQDALYRFLTEKFGNKAIEYANDIPCLIALAQSAGRLLRNPEDKGIIVLMDERAAGNFRWKLPKDWRDEMKPHSTIDKILEKIKSFYGIYVG